jgi:hypothetical protein
MVITRHEAKRVTPKAKHKNDQAIAGWKQNDSVLHAYLLSLNAQNSTHRILTTSGTMENKEFKQGW